MVKATLDGETVWSVGYPDQSEAYKPGADGKKPKWSPTNLAIAPNGDIYVGDGYGSSYILQYNSKGEYQRTFGGKGKEAGKLDCPHGIIVDTRGGDAGSDRGRSRERPHSAVHAGRRAHRFRRRHKDAVPLQLLQEWRRGDPGSGRARHAARKKNQVIEHLGDDSESKWRDTRKLSRDHFTPGKFVCPHGACFDHAGNIFVVEWVEVGRVTKLRKV